MTQRAAVMVSPPRTRRAGLRPALGVVVVLAWALLLVPRPAGAHSRSMSYAIWTIDGRAGSVELELSLLDRTVVQATTAAADPRHWQPHVAKAVRLFDSAGQCPAVPTSLRALSAPAGRVRLGWQVRCSRTEGPWRIRSDLLFDAVPSHVQLATVRFPTTTAAADVVLTGPQREASVTAPSVQGSTPWQSVSAYVELGIEHIVTGWDHLVFLLVLLLLARSLRQVAGAITGFTIGHSVTLSAAVFGYTQPDIRAVEALIGLSIAIVAAENIWLSRPSRSAAVPVVTVTAIGLSALLALLLDSGVAIAVAGVGLFAACSFGLLARLPRPERMRTAVAALFGLIHGFGFAGALDGLSPSADQLALSLFSFNLGVELGQLGCVALFWPLLVMLRRRGLQRSVVRWGSAVAAALGTYWFVLRAFS